MAGNDCVICILSEEYQKAIVMYGGGRVLSSLINLMRSDKEKVFKIINLKFLHNSVYSHTNIIASYKH